MHEKHAQYIGVEPITSRHFSSGVIRRIERKHKEQQHLASKYDRFAMKYGDNLCEWVLNAKENIETVLIFDDHLNMSKKDAAVLAAAAEVLEDLFNA